MKRTLGEKALFVADSIRAFGISTDPASRLCWLEDMISRSGGSGFTIEPSDATFQDALEAVRDLLTFEFVFEQINSDTNDPELKRCVQRATKDAVLPTRSQANSKGRDAQFELLVTAICRSAQLVPVKNEEPDVTCTISGQKFGIAAKRVKSLNRLQERIKKASDQIARSKLPGFVAVETTIALNPENDRIAKPIPEHEFSFLYKRAFDSFVDRHHSKIEVWAKRKLVRGLILHDQQVRMESHGQWGLAGMTYWVCTAGRNDSRIDEFEQFRDHYSAGLPNLQMS